MRDYSAVRFVLVVEMFFKAGIGHFLIPEENPKRVVVDFWGFFSQEEAYSSLYGNVNAQFEKSLSVPSCLAVTSALLWINVFGRSAGVVCWRVRDGETSGHEFCL